MASSRGADSDIDDFVIVGDTSDDDNTSQPDNNATQHLTAQLPAGEDIIEALANSFSSLDDTASSANDSNEEEDDDQDDLMAAPIASAVRDARPLSHDDHQEVADNLDDDDEFTLLDANADVEAFPAHWQRPPNWSQRLANSAKFATRNPFVTTVAITTALPAAINSFVSPTHSSPAVLKQFAKWWDTLTWDQKTFAIGNATASFLLNTIVNLAFLPQAARKFMDKKHPAEAVVAAILAIGAATATGMIAYNSFLWLPYAQYSASFPASFSFLTALASRYVGVSSVAHKVKTALNADAQLQTEFADMLGRLDDKMLADLQDEFKLIVAQLKRDQRNQPGGAQSPHLALTKGQFHEITKNLAAKLNAIASESGMDKPIRDRNACEISGQVIFRILDLSLGLVSLAPASFLTHMEKGFDGANLIGQGKMTNWDVWPKRAVGALGGVAPAALYTVCGMDLRAVLVASAKKLVANPASIPFATVLLLANYLSGSSMQNVAESILANPNNLVMVKANTKGWSTAYIWATTLGAAAVNTSASLKLTYLSQPVTLSTVTFNEFRAHLADPSTNRISTNTANALRTMSIFAQNGARSANGDQPHQLDRALVSGEVVAPASAPS